MPSYQPIRAVIFDMDGLMLDSEPLWYIAEIEIFKLVGIHLTDDDCRETTGIAINEIVHMRFNEKPWDEQKMSRAQVTQKVIDRVHELISTEGKPKPGLKLALELCRSKVGKKMAVASSSSVAVIQAGIDRLGIGEFFAIYCSAENEIRGKPHPGVYLSAAKALGVEPEYCLAFEDSLQGTLSAKSGRLRCVSVPEEAHRHKKGFGIADMILESLEQFGEVAWRELEFGPEAAKTECKL